VPRSSIVVSDEPLSAETNYRTEFVAVLSNQPQGGFITRQPTTDALVASDSVPGDDRFGSIFPRWDSQTGFRRNWDSQTGFQRNWDSQTDNARRRGGQDNRGQDNRGQDYRGQDYPRAQQGWGWQ
jgi:hypothetical protein